MSRQIISRPRLVPDEGNTDAMGIPGSTEGVDVLARLLESDNLDDPGPMYAWVREHLPVHRHPSGFFIAARHAEAKYVFQSSMFRGPEREDLERYFPNALKHRCVQLLWGTLAMANPPAHTRLRRLVSRDFTAKRIEALRTKAEMLRDRLLDGIEPELRDGAAVDVHSRLARPLSLALIADLIGVPEADRAEFAPMVVTVLTAANPAATDEQLDYADKVSSEVETYFHALIEQRRATPADDLISDLVSAHDDDPDRLTDEELISMAWGLWLGGFETTTAGTDNALALMLTHPHQLHWLEAGYEQAREFAQEALRFDPPSIINGIARLATEDLELGGVQIPKGSDVRTLPGTANRDPAVFDRADVFDPSHDTSEMLTFGHGMHYCLGSHLAQMDAALVAWGLHERFPALEPAGPATRRRSLPLHTFDALPVALASGKRDVTVIP
jgi:cytochrome P450